MDSVELLVWWHRRYNPAHHLGLLIHINHQKHYFSFSPRCLAGLNNLPTIRLRDGRESFIMPSEDDERLIWGLRKQWKQYKPFLTDEQKALLPSHGGIAHAGDKTLLEIAKMFPLDIQKTLHRIGAPKRIPLKKINAKLIMKKIEYYKNNPQLWAPFAGNCYRQKNTHNCASIMLDILYAGKLNKFLNSPHDWMSVIGAGLGLFSAMSMHFSLLETGLSTLFGFVITRLIGGFYEGYSGIQDYLLIRRYSQRDTWSRLLGFKIFSSVFCSVLGLITYGPVFPAFMTLPRKVISLVEGKKSD